MKILTRFLLCLALFTLPGNGFSAQIPVNDVCANAILLSSGTSCVPTAGTTEGATDNNEAGECTFGFENSVWYRFVATGPTQTVTVDGVSGFDAVVGVFTGCVGTPPAGGGCTDATGSGGVETLLLTGLTVGGTYFIQVYDVFGEVAADSDFTICVFGVSTLPPVNDACANAIALPSNPSCMPTAGTTENATDENAPGECTFGFENSVWYRFVATGPTQTVTVDGMPGFDAVVGVFTGCVGTPPAGGGCTDATGSGGVETLLLTGLTTGGTYFIQVYDVFGEVATDSDFTICVFGVSALPLELGFFTGTVQNNTNVLHWETLTEKNVQFHLVERSVDGLDWREIGRKNGLLNSALPVKYSLEDFYPLAKAYYRLRSVDFDGSTNNSNTILLVRQRELFGMVRVFPSPTKGDVVVQYNALYAEKVVVQIIDMTGRLVFSQTAEAMNDKNEWPLKLDGLPAGIYSLIVNTGIGFTQVRFVKN